MKKIFKWFLGFLLIAILTSALGAEFEKGSEFNVIRLDGVAQVFCSHYRRGRVFTRLKYIRCQDDLIYPDTYSRFIQENSNSVRVRVTNQSNRRRSKSKRFYPNRGESQPFNLLNRSIFRKPLLRHGRNILTYQMFLKDNSVEQTGSFEINVTFRRRYCPTRHMYSYGFMNCASVNTNICRRYYYEAGCLK